MKELPEQESADIAKQFDGNSWLELLDIKIPPRYEPFLQEWQTEWMSDDEQSVKHILLTNSGVTVGQYAIGWESLEHFNQRIFWEVPYQRDDISEANGDYGEVSTKITLGDPSHMLKDLVDKLNGMVGFEVVLGFAMMDKDSEVVIEGLKEGQYIIANDSVIELNFRVGTTTHDNTNFAMTLEAMLPLAWRYPTRSIIKASCQWCFKSPECGYAGADGGCSHTIADCYAKGNISRFGAFPGCGNGGLGRW